MTRAGIRTWIGALALGLLAVVAGAGCADSTLYPASLEELPPKDPPVETTAPGETPDPEDSKTEPPTSGLKVTCAVVDIGLPDNWVGTMDGSGEWVFGLPKAAGGGNLRIVGTFTPGAQVKSPSELEAMVRGEGGAKVPVQEGADGGVLSRIAIARGNEWRLAKSFPEQGTQLITVRYSPAGKATDAKVEETSALLHAATAKAVIADPGGCDK